MPVKKKVDKRKKPKQKQKQKQTVKQNVKVTVQSSGGSGGGGSSMPQPFMDRNGENVRLQNLVEQIARRIPAPAMESNLLPVRTNFPAPRYNPANDAETLNDVYNDEINNTSGFTGIDGEKLGGKAGRPKGSKNKPKIIAFPVGETSESEGYSPRGEASFQQPMGFPSQSMFMREMRAKQKLEGEEPFFS